MGDGEPRGFADFVSSRYAALVRSAYLLSGDRGDAEDLVQSALYRTFRVWETLRAVEAAEAYTRTTMVRLAGRWSRRRWRGEVPSSHLMLLADARDPRDRTEASATTLDLYAALGRLPWAQRAVLVLRFFDDLSEAQTAQTLGCTIGTVKSRASRGLASLRSAGLLEKTIDTEVRDG